MSKKITNLSKSSLVVIIVCSLLVLIGAVTGITYAVWSASDNKEVDVGTGDWYNPSEKYFVFEILQGNNRFPFVADQNTIYDPTTGKSIKPTFILYNDYFNAENGYNTGVTFNPGATIDKVTVIGYVGNVNEIAVPDTVKISSVATEQKVTAISVDSHEFEAIRLVASLTVGVNVIEISPFTFSNCTYLSEIVFKAKVATTVTIGEYAFYNCPLMTASNVTKGSAILSLGEMAGKNPNTNTNFLS